MLNTLKLHFDILDKKRQELLKIILPIVPDFTLGGGTALALQLKHRKSFDFDFFSEKEIDRFLIDKLAKKISIDKTQINTSDELTLFTKEQVKLSFIFYPFKEHFLKKIVIGGINIFPVEEIAAQKAYAIGRRGEYRDYFDLYTILKTGKISFPQLNKKTKRIYKELFDEKLFLEQLTYYKDILNFKIIPIQDQARPTLEEVKKYFEKLVEDYLS